MSNILVSAIVAASANNCIGRKNDLPWHIPGDLKRLKDITMGKPMVMGRKTHESVSAHREGKPLPGRAHFVISRDMVQPDIEGVFVYRSLEDALTAAKDYAQAQHLDEVIIFGGAQIYAQALPLTDKIYLTRVDTVIEDGDAFFPVLNAGEWTESAAEHHQTESGLAYSYITLSRKIPS